MIQALLLTRDDTTIASELVSLERQVSAQALTHEDARDRRIGLTKKLVECRKPHLQVS